MSQEQDLGLGGLAFRSTNDLSGTLTDVTNGNPLGSPFKNGAGLAVVIDPSNSKNVVLAGANVPIIGVLANTPKAAEAADVRGVRGSSRKVLAGAAIAVGAKLSTDAYGRMVTAAGAAQIIVAIAAEAASAAGDLIEAVLIDSYVA